MALRSGDVLLKGRYRITRRLDQGGMRNVYLAEDTLLNRDVAVKELIPGIAGDDAVVKRLLALAEAAKDLRNERIVAVYDVLAEEDAAGQTRHFVVMEYMPGGSLEDVLRHRDSLPAADAARIAADVCEGLAFAHDRGIVHCALRPANILFSGEAPGSVRGTAKVAGFGVAGASDKMLSRIWPSSDGFAAGTLPYMSPERLEGLSRDPRIDVYSMGAILYRMLSGRTYLEFDEQPVIAATARNVERIRKQKPVRPGSQVPRVPAWLDAAVLKALAKRSKDRFLDCDQFGKALTEPDPKAVAAAPRGRRLLPLAIGALVLIALIALVAAGTQFVPGWIDDWHQASTAQAAEALAALNAAGTASAEQTRLAVPTVTPTPSPVPPTVTPSPTISLEPPPSPTAAHSATPIATETPVPPDTPTITPVPPTASPTPLPPTATNTLPPPPSSTPPPTPTPTPRPLHSAPVLLEPGEAATFAHGSEFYLHWSWNGELAAGEYFDVRIWLDEQPHWGLGWTKDDRYRLTTEDLSNRFPDAKCGAALNWAVAVVEGQDGTLSEERSPESDPRVFYVEFTHCR